MLFHILGPEMTRNIALTWMIYVEYGNLDNDMFRIFENTTTPSEH